MSQQLDFKSLCNRFPKFELSYETISHKKVSSPYDVALAIPLGRKYYAWFSFHKNKDVCYLMELTRDKKIGKISIVNVEFSPKLALGTILYGTICEEEQQENSEKSSIKKPGFFVIEDIIYYQGNIVKTNTFSEKLGITHQLLTEHLVQKPNANKVTSEIVFTFPMMWSYNSENPDVPMSITERCGYQIHHIQYRSMHSVVPYINLSANRKINAQDEKKTSLPVFRKIPEMDFSKPQYKYPAVFQIMADQQFDIYHLYAYGQQNQEVVYCGVASIPNYKTSVFMNGLFRNIRENKNLDYIEESDDEEDFENIDENKYVDLQKTILMECVFHQKFKKWVPMTIVSNGTPLVHINKLEMSNENIQHTNFIKKPPHINHQKQYYGKNKNAQNYNQKYHT